MFSLSQNYLNPFNPTIVISYSVPSLMGRDGQLPVASYVRLVVYDLLGCEVVVLVNERKGAGKYGVTFNAGGLSSGVYFYRLSISPLARRDLVTRERDGQAGTYVQTRELLLLR